MSNFRTPLYSWHIDRSARIVPFGGWDMPVQYAGVIVEHKAVRSANGIFDISHMARFRVEGVSALPLLERIFTNSVGTMAVGQVRYGLVCKDDGGILDDILITRQANHYDVCVNAGNREKILGWLHTQTLDQDVTIQDQTFETCMIALQGPTAVAAVAGLFADDVAKLKYYYAMPTSYHGVPVVVSRTGYTGEDGLEVIVPNEYGLQLWEELIGRGAVPCGLGARDTLRLEAAMALYGHELDESIDPITAGLGWAVKLDKGEFIGRDALRSVLATTAEYRRQRIGLVLEGKRAAREGSNIVSADGTVLGPVTSGSYVPWLERSIAMGYVRQPQASIGADVLIDIRGTQAPAKIVSLPFYSRKKG